MATFLPMLAPGHTPGPPHKPATTATGREPAVNQKADQRPVNLYGAILFPDTPLIGLAPKLPPLQPVVKP